MPTTKNLLALQALAAPARTDNIPRTPIFSINKQDFLTLKELIQGTCVFGELGAGKTSSTTSKLKSAGSASTCGSGYRAALTRIGAARAKVRRPESILKKENPNGEGHD